jgi:hypothetical protein
LLIYWAIRSDVLHGSALKQSDQFIPWQKTLHK